ncbi:autotransporter [Conexibacter stalactiti]|uniref:Autotransporter n=1 Tax=Conexibacter stalactiti TaxID=1940611 RepID=A0ABU4HV54_9ACTN|nr:autotransporter [Conexibacter stalactiti]MDW5597118.1 autotransporter [Conexibacter stalactiti]MEC5037760.1 autotransporter [Conexibacter stalactiti]
MSSNRRGSIARAIALVAGAIATIAVVVGPAEADPIAQAARTLDINEHADLRLTRRSGSTLWHSGTATGTLPGSVSARFEMTLTKVTGTVTIRPRSGGSLTINVVGYAKSAGVNARFSGNMAVRKGTGRYKNAVGSGTFDGTVNRRSFNATVTAKAKLTY